MSTETLNNTATATEGQITDGPVTLANAEEASPGLVKTHIDRRITKVRPMSTPIDQLSRCGASRTAKSMVVEYYSVDPKRTASVVAVDMSGGAGKRRADGIYVHNISTEDDLLFEPSETLLMPTVMVKTPGSKNAEPLMLYVVARNSTTGLEVMAINAPCTEPGKTVLPAIAQGEPIVRMGRAAAELDVQTPQFQAMPTKARNHCQIFKMQVEEGVLFRMADKEADWSLNDQEEAAIIDMRLGMEKNFIFGTRAKIIDPVKNEEVYLTGGIWHQAGREMELIMDEFTEKSLIDIAQKAFTGNCGSKNKIFVCGSGLLNKISKIECQRVRRANDAAVQWGLVFSEIVTNFGTLRVIHSEIFDQCGHENDGLVIDPEYLTKFVHVPFHVEQLDLRRSGTRNTSAAVITEASCVVLRYPDTHLRVMGVVVNKDSKGAD